MVDKFLILQKGSNRPAWVCVSGTPFDSRAEARAALDTFLPIPDTRMEFLVVRVTDEAHIEQSLVEGLAP